MDEEKIVFPRTELILFLRHVYNNVWEFTCNLNLKRFPTKFLEMCRSSVINNGELEVDFRLLIASLSLAKVASNCDIVDRLFKAFVSKLANMWILRSRETSRRTAELWTQMKCSDLNASHTHWLPNASNCVLLFSIFVYYYYLQPS